MSRKSLSKKVRFEVLKRARFKCQYCGRGVEEGVVLHIDHIEPVALGGDNDLLNLTVACEGCNQGKGDRPLEDSSVHKKRRAQLEALQELREQQELMKQWHDELRDSKDAQLEYVVARIDDAMAAAGVTVNETGRKTLKKFLRKHGFEEVVESVDIALDQYLEYPDGNTPTKGSLEHAFEKLGGILYHRAKAEADPEHERKQKLSWLFYRHFLEHEDDHRFERWRAVKLIEEMREKGYAFDQIAKLALDHRRLSSLRQDFYSGNLESPEETAESCSEDLNEGFESADSDRMYADRYFDEIRRLGDFLQGIFNTTWGDDGPEQYMIRRLLNIGLIYQPEKWVSIAEIAIYAAWTESWEKFWTWALDQANFEDDDDFQASYKAYLRNVGRPQLPGP